MQFFWTDMNKISSSSVYAQNKLHYLGLKVQKQYFF